MDIRKLDDTLSVSPQLTLDDVAVLAARGITTLVSNRPDGEAPGQLDAAGIAAAAAAHGIAFVHLPVVATAIDDAAVDAFARLLSASTGPVHAFCRTGTRSTTLWALAQAGTHPVPALLATAATAGYDLAPLRPRLDARAAARPRPCSP